MPSIALQRGIIYGPILSRRLGRSLGINLMPVDCKVCSFDCVYCQYGCTDILTQSPSHHLLPAVTDVRTALVKALRKPRTIDTLTFSGNGESTLHPNFLEIVRAVKALRDVLRPSAKLAVLTNSSTINQEEIQIALDMVDAPMMKLDAGDPQTFIKINRPVSGIEFFDIIKGMKSVSHLMLQTMFVDGDISNTRGEAYQAWVNLVGELQPSLVHIYSIERPTAELGFREVEPKKLHKIAEDLQKKFGIKIEAFYRS